MYSKYTHMCQQYVFKSLNCFLTLGPGFPSSPLVPGTPFGPGGPFKMQESDETVSHLSHVLVKNIITWISNEWFHFKHLSCGPCSWKKYDAIQCDWSFGLLFVLLTKCSAAKYQLTLDPPIPGSPAGPDTPGPPEFPFEQQIVVTTTVTEADSNVEQCMISFKKTNLQAVRVSLSYHQVPDVWEQK